MRQLQARARACAASREPVPPYHSRSSVTQHTPKNAKNAMRPNDETQSLADSHEPSRDCPLCPRLVAFRHSVRAREPSWFNAPVPSFGLADARLLIVGLAPGLRGANRTGRPFTGDYAGDLLFRTLVETGFARGRYEARPDDDLTLVDARI